MEKIAVIGTGCLLPGYTTKELLWNKLIEGKCFYSEEKYEGRIIERGHLYQKDSAAFFSKQFNKEMLETLDRKGEIYKWSTYVVKEALKESGYLSDRNVLSNTGIVMGTLGMFVPEYISMFGPLVKAKIENNVNLLLRDETFRFFNSKENEKINKNKCYVDTDNIKTIADLFGLGKVSLSMSAACSTPLYAIKLGCLYLSSHKADMMVVGSNCENESVSDVCGIFELLGILTEKGTCNPLNKNTQGLIISSGAGAVVLKRLDDAVRDKDHILAVIESIGWSNDGGAKSLLAPCMEGQISSYRDAYKNGVDDDIDYIECHSTGTAAGDLEEYKSIASYFYDRDKNPFIGTLKGNTGHFLTASAMGAVIKVILSMQHNMIPKTARITEPVGKEVVTENIPWPQKDREKRAAINAFGFGGINAHLVLKEYTGKKETSYPLKAQQNNKIVVTGMDLQIGTIRNKETLFECIANGCSAVSDNIGNRFSQDDREPAILRALELEEYPKGAYIHEIPFDFLKFKFATRSNMHYTRRDMLLMNVANRALMEADITVGSLSDTAVIINAGQDFAVLNYRASEELHDQMEESFECSCKGLTEGERRKVLSIVREDERSVESAESIVGIIPSIRGSRISSHWHFKGPSFVLTEQEEAFPRSLELAHILLERNIVKCVVIGTVELLGETEFLYAEKLGGNLDKIQKYGIGEGSAVLVLKTEEEASRSGDTAYGYADDILAGSDNKYSEMLDYASGYSVSLKKYMEVIMRAMEKYYGYSLPESSDQQDQSGAEELFAKLRVHADLVGEKVKNESRRSFIKNIPTALPEMKNRDAYKKHIHNIGPEHKEGCLPSKENDLYVRNYEHFLNFLSYEGEELEKWIAKTVNKEKSCLWNREEIVEMTNGSMSKILGSRYENIDRYKVRSRMPSPPYLFVTRITKLDAEFGTLRPASAEIEYDVDDRCIYLQGDGTISNVVYTEASQIGIFLGSYMGADITGKSTLRFRVVDSRITVMSNKPARLGDTLRLTYRIKSFMKRGDTLFAFSSYECYNGNTMLIKTDAIGGFFAEEDLQGSKGMLDPKFKLTNKDSGGGFRPRKRRSETSYTKPDVERFFEGDFRGCFGGRDLYGPNPLLYIRPEVRMLDEVTDISMAGGKYGLGYIKGEKRIDPSHWAFQAHFKNDPVFPGTLILNGANQLFAFFAVYCGFYDGNPEQRPEAVEGITVEVAFRGQVRPEPSVITYVIDIKELSDREETEDILAEVNVYWKDINVIREDNISLRFLKYAKEDGESNE